MIVHFISIIILFSDFISFYSNYRTLIQFKTLFILIYVAFSEFYSHFNPIFVV